MDLRGPAQDALRHLTVGTHRLRRRAWVRFCRASGPERAVWGLVAAEALIFVLALATPRLGQIVPVGRSVGEAYHMLARTPSGRRLVRRVRRAARGDFIYLAMGDTERDRLFDTWGREVRGVTRAVMLFDGRRYAVRHVTVITNRDVTGSAPTEIVKSLAFELENVLQVYRRPGSERGIDSPLARVTQAQVLRELGVD